MTSEIKETNEASSPQADTSTNIAFTVPPEPDEEPIKEPLHDCIICDPFEQCKHTVPLHEGIKPMIRGKTGVEDMFLKLNEIAEWLMENDIRLGATKHQKS